MAVGEQCGCDPAARHCNCPGSFYGLIQHSFALQLALRRQPFYGRTNYDRVNERFSLREAKNGPFPVRGVNELVKLGDDPDTVLHSPLAAHWLTTIQSLKIQLLRRANRKKLPSSLGWSEGGKDQGSDEYEDPRMIFADTFDDESRPTVSDFMVDAPAPYRGADISQTLLEVMAHKRSRLFGFALANRIVNVMLPHAILESTWAPTEGHSWFLQPLVSFIRGGRDRTRLRGTYSLTLFLLPVTVGETFGSRQMSTAEIGQIGTPGWGFAASPTDPVPEFKVHGPLFEYLTGLSRFDLREMRRPPRKSDPDQPDCIGTCDPLTLRQAVEKIGFGVGLSVAQGSAGSADLLTMRRIGNDVVMSLGSAGVSSVVVVDDALSASEIRNPIQSEPFPGSLSSLMASLAEPLRSPRSSDPGAKKLRLDRPFDDDEIYATGVIPSKRCLVVASRRSAQFGARESALMQAGSIGYMTLGAATAIGTLREIDKQLEHLEGANPSSVAAIDREIAADLNEIYDLDITRESYRRMYRRLRDRLGITRDYKTLQDEMNALHRATSTVHGDKAQRMLAVLTAAIVVLSVLILIGTLVLIGKPGG